MNNPTENQSPTLPVGFAEKAAVEPRSLFIGRYRWVICSLLFFALTINYVDRQIIGILKPTLKTELGWNELDYGTVVFWFQTAYAAGLLLSGRFIDAVGTRRGLSATVIFWSIAGMLHAAAQTVTGFSLARLALGFGEAGIFPAAVKTVAEWFPKKERALATGLFNTGTNIGAIITPLAIPPLAAAFGWRRTFIITGLLGFVWLVFWLASYRRPAEHPGVSKAELDHIQSDPPESVASVTWAKVFPHRQTWAYVCGKFLTDPIWVFYLFWLPEFFQKKFGLTGIQIGAPMAAIYLSAGVGSIGGGWLPTPLLERGWSHNGARKTAMLVCALCVTPIAFIVFATNLWVAVTLISLAAAAHQGWSANLLTTPSDLFPKRGVGSVAGIGGMAGAVGGMLIARVTGYVLHVTGSYVPLFIGASLAYLLALAIFHLLSPKLETANLDN